LRLYDAPGVCDLELPLARIVADIKVTIGSDKPIDAALIFLKASDYRMNMEQTVAIKIISKFFQDFEPKKVFMVITHTD
jgi:hypothetical protein